MNLVEGGVTTPRGFRAAGVAAAIKAGTTKKDCALVVSDAPATLAGVFTSNLVKAAPVLWCMEVCRGGSARAIFANSGNANACTGAQGLADVRATAQLVADGLHISPHEVAVCSTGVIGARLPMNRIAQGVRGCVEVLSTDGGSSAAEAIMTTDTLRKELAVELSLGNGVVRIGAMAKGSGMIAPNMATMLCFLTTDAAIDKTRLDVMLRQAVNESFNRICVDNDTSTNDTVLCLANGQSSTNVSVNGQFAQQFERALTGLCQEMARKLVQDGEGATKFVEILVSGAASDDDATRIARAVAASQLCKTAFFGEDPNWGRVACAAGYSGANFDPARLGIRLDEVEIVRGGIAADYSEADAAAVMKRPGFQLRIEVGDGPGRAAFWTSDLSYDYVRINAAYRS